jgi:pimeloyl-ACP methyl ester carboxylesterase
MTTSVVSFANQNNLALYGMLHQVDHERKKVGIIILSPGIKNRVAPHRLYVKMANRLHELGFEVFRFDPEGLGDSEGEIDCEFAADLYGSIQTGRFVADTHAAMDWLERERGISEFVLAGLCGGAITGLLAASGQPRVVGLLALGIPVILDGTDIDKVRFMTQEQAGYLRKWYFRRLLQPRSWLRLLTLKTDFRVLVRSLLDVKPSKQAAEPNDSPDDGNFNPLFPTAFESFAASNGQMLFVFSEADRLYWEFQEKFLGRYGAMAERFADRFEVHMTAGANHIFSLKEWQEDMLQMSSSWMLKHFAAS